ncbi:MAG TPA: cohesin domain-containing protein [Candidatus Paceibacterota bacterium]|nr:cohesin domain-containing protein [Candidatus Paceibacterota bacterium]
MIKKIIKNINFSFVALVIILSFFTARESLAYTEVYFQAPEDIIQSGDTFTVLLKISSKDKKINAINGTILYDNQFLKVKSINKDNSILSLWVKEPTYNNEEGKISLIGGSPEGFLGEGGEVLNITFKAKKGGLTKIGYEDVFSVFLNDGKGTQVNPWLKPMNIKIENLLGKTTYALYTLSVVFILIILFIIIKRRKKNKKDVA